MSMFTLTLHHQPHHIIAVWLLASASILALAFTPKGPYSRGIAGWTAACFLAAAGAAVTACTAGYLPVSGATILAAILIPAGVLLAAGESAATRRYWRRAAADAPPQRHVWW